MTESSLFKYCPNTACPFYVRHGKSGEYRPDIDRCSDCGTALVFGGALHNATSSNSGNPDREHESNTGLVFLERFSHNIEASAARSLLDAHGINSFIQGEQHRSMLGVAGTYIELNLLVAAADFERANQIITQASFVSFDDAEPAESPEEIASRQKLEVRRKREVRWLAALVLFLTL